MARRNAAIKREVLPDAKYNSPIVTKIINAIMKNGKKSIAEKLFYSATAFVEDKLNQPVLEIIETVLNNVRPEMEVKSRRVGGATYQVPRDVPPQRSVALGIRGLVRAAQKRKDKPTFWECFAAEMLDAFSEKGEAVKKRQDTHKMAEANRAFIHYNW